MISPPPVPLRPHVPRTNSDFVLLTAPLIAVLLVAPFALAADRVSVEKPVAVAVTKTDKSKIVGRITSYDPASFELVKRGDDEPVEVKWAELDASTVYQIRMQLISKPEGPAWLAVGRDMRCLPGADRFVERAFANAIKADPSLKDAVEAARNAPPVNPAPAGQDPNGPWRRLTADEQAAAIRALDDFADSTQSTMDVKLVRHETAYFLFYTDLPPNEGKRWAELLDKMYGRLAELFATGRNVNVWRGKALVFVFAKSADYQRFERQMHHTDAGGAMGMCHNFPGGDVHIAFYRQPDEKAFAHVLVHESVHGFLHRFRTPVSIPSWVNEGLAETIATELVPRPGGNGNGANANANGGNGNDPIAAARSAVEQHGNSLGGMFDAKPISDWQYPLAQTVTEFIIQRNKRGYVNFITAIKDGTPWTEALKEKLKTDRASLAKVYGEEALKVKGLKP